MKIIAKLSVAQPHELPKPGDHFVCSGRRFKVVDMDGRRIDMMPVQRPPDAIIALKT